MKSKIRNPKSKIVIVLLIATFLRFYQLPPIQGQSLPPGLNFDEAGNGVAALDILNGLPKIWWTIGGGKEPLWPYIIALSTLILNPTPLALRLPAALIGILTVATVYPLIKTLFRRHQPLALLTMLGLALSGWHLHFSRLGFRTILLPCLSILAFYFLWRGLIKSRITFHISRFTFRLPTLQLSSFFLALAIYSYLAARFLPFVLILFFVLNRLRHRLFTKQIKTTHSPLNNQLPITNYKTFIPSTSSGQALYPLSFILYLTPLALYFILNPTHFIARATTVSIFNPAWNNGDLLGTIWRTLLLTLSAYLGLHGDANPLVNLPHQPILPAFLAPFFILGIITSIYHTIRLAALSPRSPHLFLLCWWAVMLLPAILAPEGAPHHLRLFGTIIPTYAFLALGVVTLTKFITHHASRITPHASRIAYFLPITCYLLLGLQTYTNYFIHWPQSTNFTLPFDLYATRLADDIAQTPPNAVYVLPMDIRASTEARHYTLDYLLSPHQPPISNNQLLITNNQSPYTYLPIDEHNAETVLTMAIAGKDELRIVRWTDDKHREADAKEIVTYLLETTAHFVKRESFPVYDIETYAVDNKNFTLPAINKPINANFDNLLRLDAAFIPTNIAPNNWLPVALTLAPLAPMKVDYKASARLIGPTGERLSQKDRTLRHNFHQGTSLWPIETVNEYYLLSIPSNALPGNYTVAIVIYHPDTLAPLVANGLVEVPLGVVRIEK